MRVLEPVGAPSTMAQAAPALPASPGPNCLLVPW